MSNLDRALRKLSDSARTAFSDAPQPATLGAHEAEAILGELRKERKRGDILCERITQLQNELAKERDQ